VSSVSTYLLSTIHLPFVNVRTLPLPHWILTGPGRSLTLLVYQLTEQTNASGTLNLVRKAIMAFHRIDEGKK
jgi:hypothetical protein